MTPRRTLLIVCVAGTATTAMAVLFATNSVPGLTLPYSVVGIAMLAAAAGTASAILPQTTRPLLRIGAFATGMFLSTVAFAFYTHFASAEVEDPRHRVAWPLFALVFIAAILLGVAAFSAATALTSAMVRYRHSKPSEQP